MAVIAVICPACKKDKVVKFGVNSAGKQRYQCKNTDCDKKTFLLNYSRNGDLPEVKQKIIEMALNGSGIRDTARVLGISINTVISELKKKDSALETVNHAFLQRKQAENTSITIDIVKVEEIQMDEMWSFVGKKENQRWLWHAIDHETHEVLAYCFGERKDVIFREL